MRAKTVERLRWPGLSPEARALLETLPPQRAWHEMSPSDIRAMPTPLPAAPEAVGLAMRRQIPGPGGPLTIRMYRPTTRGPHAALIYLHGGGWIFGDLDGFTDRYSRQLVNRAGCIVITVDYRLAPEAKFPAAVDDVYAAFLWTAASAADLELDPSRIAVGGFSAGGNLAAAVALMARDRGGPRPAFQLLEMPITDSRCSTASAREFADGPLWTLADMRWSWAHYLARSEDADHPYASVLRAPDLSSLPPALVVTAGRDPLRDEGEAYAARLRSARVDASIRRYEGMPHAFTGFSAVLEDGRRAIDDTAAELARRLAI